MTEKKSHRANYRSIGARTYSPGVCRCGNEINWETQESCRLTGTFPMCEDCYEVLVEVNGETILSSDIIGSEQLNGGMALHLPTEKKGYSYMSVGQAVNRRNLARSEAVARGECPDCAVAVMLGAKITCGTCGKSTII